MGKWNWLLATIYYNFFDLNTDTWINTNILDLTLKCSTPILLAMVITYLYMIVVTTLPILFAETQFISLLSYLRSNSGNCGTLSMIFAPLRNVNLQCFILYLLDTLRYNMEFLTREPGKNDWLPP